MDETAGSISPPGLAADLPLAIEDCRLRVKDLLGQLGRPQLRAQTALSSAAQRAAELERHAVAAAQFQQDLATLRTELSQRENALAESREHEARLEADWKALRARQSELSIAYENARQQQVELAAQLEALRKRHGELTAERAMAQTREAEAAFEVEAARAQHAAMAAELRAAKGRFSEAAAERDLFREKADELQLRLEQRQAEADELRRQVAALRDELAEAIEAANSHQEADASEDYRRRYELALEDVQDLKAQLEQQTRPPASQPVAAGLDWEAEKRKILASLEAEGEDEEQDDDGRRRRIEIHRVLESTSRIVAEKDREIAELKQLLSQQSENLGAVAVGAAAVGQIVDSDPIIREERDTLRQLQEEWREKLRHAEIEVSLERAKIARERAQLEDKLRGAPEPPKEAEKEKPARGRWLSRLGLRDADD